MKLLVNALSFNKILLETHRKSPTYNLKRYEEIHLTKIHIDLITATPSLAFTFAYNVIRGRFPAGEQIMATHANISYVYALWVLEDKFPLGEPAIAKDGSNSVQYAKFVLKGKFELGEKVIAESTHYSFWYALEILKGRFYLGEQKMCLYPDDPFTQQYIIHFGELRYKRYEELFETNTSR